jgi:hypothetical protein
MLFGVSGSTRLAITSAGSVGIGTTSPNQKLELKAASTNVALRLNDGSHYWDVFHTSLDNTLKFNYDGTTTLRLGTQGSTVFNHANSPYGRMEVMGLQSSFTNPATTLLTFNADSSYASMTVKVRVFQNSISGGYGNIHSGVAVIQLNPDRGSIAKYAGTMTTEGGNMGNVGTLSWSGDSLVYTPSRITNYDFYTVIVEYGGVNMNIAPSFNTSIFI